MPPALHLHLWHHISGVSIYVPKKRMAHPGTGDVLYWFHSRSRLADSAQWPCLFGSGPWFVMWWTFQGRKRLGTLRIVIAGLFCGMGRVHTAFSPGTPTETAHLHRHVSDNGGTCGVSTSKLLTERTRHTQRGFEHPSGNETLRHNATAEGV